LRGDFLKGVMLRASAEKQREVDDRASAHYPSKANFRQGFLGI